MELERWSLLGYASFATQNLLYPIVIYDNGILLLFYAASCFI